MEEEAKPIWITIGLDVAKQELLLLSMSDGSKAEARKKSVRAPSGMEVEVFDITIPPHVLYRQLYGWFLSEGVAVKDADPLVKDLFESITNMAEGKEVTLYEEDKQ